LCEHVNADAVSLSLALGLDKKIAPRCLQPGAGMGGLFAESDMESLAELARGKGVSLKVLTAAREVNHSLAELIMDKISTMVHSVQNKDVGILGLAFKPNTNSVAGSSSLHLAKSLVENGARVRAYDPVAIPEARMQLNGAVHYCESAYAAAEGVKATFIASISRESSRGFSTGYYVKESSPIRSVTDLRGKTVGINGFSTSGHLWLKAALDRHGLAETDVKITPVPFSAMQESLDAGKIDIGQFPQPFAALAEKQMKVRKIFDAKYGIPFEEELTVLVGKDAFLKKNAAAIRAMLQDLTAAMQFYLERPREARQLLIDARMVRVLPDVYMGMQDYYRDPTLRVDVEALERMQAFQIKAGFQRKNADVRSLVDLSYLPQ